MTFPTSHHTKPFRLLGILALGLVLGGWPSLPATARPSEESTAGPILQKGDRVAWIGSSSTRIGVWPETVAFLLRTRHPELGLQFQRFTTGGGTFATGLEHMDEWLGDFRPTVVIFNYGGNDAGAGRKGLPQFRENMERSIARVRESGARVILSTFQAADVRKAKAGPAARRALYAEEMLHFAREKGWMVIDVFHPLDLLQRANEKRDPAYTILRDTIHLTDPAYIAWGYYFYDRLPLPFERSMAVLSADGRVKASVNCEIADVEASENALAFTRIDEVLPILPPGPLPPRLSVPLESQSRYLLAVEGLAPGEYEIRCLDRPIGVVDAEALALGVNLNTVLLDEGREAPWAEFASALWEDQRLDEIGQTRWRFEVRKR